MGTLFGLKAFAVAILGGITSAWGVMLAGLLFGIVEALITATLGSCYTQILSFALVIVALALRAERPLRPRGGEEGMRPSPRWHRRGCLRRRAIAVHRDGANSYYVFVMATLALTGDRRHRPQRAARADRAGVLRPRRLLRASAPMRSRSSRPRPKWSFWAGAAGRRPARRRDRRPARAAGAAREGPYLAMVTIAFGFIVENGAVEWRGLTGGQNGIMGIAAPSLVRRERRARRGDAGHRRCAALALAAIRLAGARHLGRGDARGARRRDRRRIDRPRSGRVKTRRLRHLGRLRRASPAGCSRRSRALSRRSTFGFSSRSCSCWW